MDQSSGISVFRGGSTITQLQPINASFGRHRFHLLPKKMKSSCIFLPAS